MGDVISLFNLLLEDKITLSDNSQQFHFDMLNIIKAITTPTSNIILVVNELAP